MAAASASTPADSCSSPTPNVPNASNVDNTDLRPYTTTFDLFGNELRVGTTINNNPTVQDPYNSTFAWGYPYIASQLAPTPSASPILASGFNNNSIGYTVYAWYDRHLYLEAGAYTTLGTWALARIGNDFGVGSSQGAMPYLRAAYEWDWNQQAFHIGAIYMQSNVNPVSGMFQTDGSLGRDHFTDYVIDAGYQWLGDGNHIVTVLGTFTHEDQNLEGTTAGYNAANGTTFGPKSNFNQVQLNASYWYQNTYGLTLAWQNTWGPANPQLYTTGSDMTNSVNGKPNSNAFIIEADWVPFGKAGLMAAPVGQPETRHPVHPRIRSSTAAPRTTTASVATPATTTRCSCSPGWRSEDGQPRAPAPAAGSATPADRASAWRRPSGAPSPAAPCRARRSPSAGRPPGPVGCLAGARAACWWRRHGPRRCRAGSPWRARSPLPPPA